jgi:hypothetical protein
MTARDRKPAPPTSRQPTLFELPRDSPEPFKKPVPILHSRAAVQLTLLQRRLCNVFLKNAATTDEDGEGYFEITRSTFRRDLGFDSHNVEHLADACRALQMISFEWDVLALADKRVKWKGSVLLPEIEIRTNSVRYQVSPQIRPQLKEPDVYAFIDMAIVRLFTSANSLAIWEFGVRYQKIGKTAPVPWGEFRDMILGDESAKSVTYREYKHFKGKVLKRALVEIATVSDHIFELREIRDGRRVLQVFFELRRKDAGKLKELDLPGQELVQELRALGLPQSEAIRTVKNHTHQEIERALRYLRSRMQDKSQPKIKSVPAYFRTILVRGIETLEPAAAKAKGPAEDGPKLDLRAEYLKEKVAEAGPYFNELGPEEQTALIGEYDEQQHVASLRLTGKKRSPAPRAAFLAWLARKTWGEPTAEDLVKFAEQRAVIARPARTN